jgi:hypothetical protein
MVVAVSRHVDRWRDHGVRSGLSGGGHYLLADIPFERLVSEEAALSQLINTAKAVVDELARRLPLSDAVSGGHRPASCP